MNPRANHYPPSAVGVPARQLGSVAMRYGPPTGRWGVASWHLGPIRARPPRPSPAVGDPKGPLSAGLQRLEAVLFLAREPLNTRKLSQYAGLADGTEARTLANRLNHLYDRSGRAFRIEEVAGGLQLRSRAVFGAWIRRLQHVPGEIRLSAPALETLAVVAYRQPVFRADVEAVRGVACGEILRQLMQRELVRVAGRSEELGRPFYYGTTKRFLELFGLRSLDELPNKQVYSHALPEGSGEGSQSGVQSCEEMPQLLEEEGDRTVSVTTMQQSDLGQISIDSSAPDFDSLAGPANAQPLRAQPRASDEDEWEDEDEDEDEYEFVDDDEDDEEEWEDVEEGEEEDDDYEYEDDDDVDDDDDGDDDDAGGGDEEDDEDEDDDLEDDDLEDDDADESEWEDVDDDEEEDDEYEYEDDDDDEWEEVEDDDVDEEEEEDDDVDEEFEGEDEVFDDDDEWDDDEEEDDEKSGEKSGDKESGDKESDDAESDDEDDEW